MLSIKVIVNSQLKNIPIKVFIKYGVERAIVQVQKDVKKSFGTRNTPKVRTGNLRRSIKSSVKISGAFTVGSIGSDCIYAKIQEFGGTIHAKAGGYLKFKIQNQWHTCKSVTIPPRPYLQPALERNEEQIKSLVKEEILRGIKNWGQHA